MDKPWEALMDIGIVHFMVVPEVIKDEGPIVESAAKLAEDDFFNVLEVRRSDDPDVMEGLKRVADSAHISLGVGAQRLGQGLSRQRGRGLRGVRDRPLAGARRSAQLSLVGRHRRDPLPDGAL